jgi:hypothetical protein
MANLPATTPPVPTSEELLQKQVDRRRKDSQLRQERLDFLISNLPQLDAHVASGALISRQREEWRNSSLSEVHLADI